MGFLKQTIPFCNQVQNSHPGHHMGRAVSQSPELSCIVRPVRWLINVTVSSCRTVNSAKTTAIWPCRLESWIMLPHCVCDFLGDLRSGTDISFSAATFPAQQQMVWHKAGHPIASDPALHVLVLVLRCHTCRTCFLFTCVSGRKALDEQCSKKRG